MNQSVYKLPMLYNHIVPILLKRIRLQEYGVGIFIHIASKSALKKAINKNRVYVNDKIATTGTFIGGGEMITYHHPIVEEKNSRLKLNLDVVYEDDFLAIVHKPAGILVSGNTFKTVANALDQNLKQSNALDTVKPQPVHRLDFATSGLLLIGKTSSSITALNKLFEKKLIFKTYFAVTIGGMKSQGIIKSLVDDKEAISLFQIRETIPSERFGCLNLVQLNPTTGRRHQLRKHLLSIGNPILGDSTYFLENLLLKGKGLYLHAQSLEFPHPITKEKKYITSKLPNKFEKIFPKINFQL